MVPLHWSEFKNPKLHKISAFKLLYRRSMNLMFLEKRQMSLSPKRLIQEFETQSWFSPHSFKLGPQIERLQLRSLAVSMWMSWWESIPHHCQAGVANIQNTEAALHHMLVTPAPWFWCVPTHTTMGSHCLSPLSLHSTFFRCWICPWRRIARDARLKSYNHQMNMWELI